MAYAHNGGGKAVAHSMEVAGARQFTELPAELYAVLNPLLLRSCVEDHPLHLVVSQDCQQALGRGFQGACVFPGDSESVAESLGSLDVLEDAQASPSKMVHRVPLGPIDERGLSVLRFQGSGGGQQQKRELDFDAHG